MAYASLQGRVSTKRGAAAICDRCGGVWNHRDLSWQVEWRGAVLQNIRLLVCKSCYDTPNEQLRAITLPADPVPIANARVQDFDDAASDYRAVSAPTVLDPKTGIPIPSTTLRTTVDGQNRVTKPVGIPEDLDANAVMPFNGGNLTAYGKALAVLSVTSNGTATVNVTCSAVHGLIDDNQVVIAGLSNTAACGFYGVDVLTSTSFNYMTQNNIPAAMLLTPTTRIITALIGLPRGFLALDSP